MGDLDDSGDSDASDASMILVAAARAGLKDNDYGLTPVQIARADVNHDGVVDSVDASIVLVYASAKGLDSSAKLEDYIPRTTG